MRVIPPLAITDGMLTSSTCAEPHASEAEFDINATYAKGELASIGSPTSAVTITIASPAVVTWTDHGLTDGIPVTLATTVALPTGLTPGRVYFVINSTANTLQLSEEPAGLPVITTGSQSGTHTLKAQVHRKYESLVASNVGHAPLQDAVGAYWADVGPSNRWAMFDLLRNTGTMQASPLTVVITPGQRVDALALVGLVAEQG